MKKYISLIVCVLVGLGILTFVVHLLHHLKIDFKNDDNVGSVSSGVIASMIMFYWAGTWYGRGRSFPANFYLYDGQPFQLAGFHSDNNTYHILVKFKPELLGYLTLDVNRFSGCDGDLKLGHWYRYLDGNISPLPFGKKEMLPLGEKV